MLLFWDKISGCHHRNPRRQGAHTGRQIVLLSAIQPDLTRNSGFQLLRDFKFLILAKAQRAVSWKWEAEGPKTSSSSIKKFPFIFAFLAFCAACLLRWASEKLPLFFSVCLLLHLSASNKSQGLDKSHIWTNWKSPKEFFCNFWLESALADTVRKFDKGSTDWRSEGHVTVSQTSIHPLFHPSPPSVKSRE